MGNCDMEVRMQNVEREIEQLSISLEKAKLQLKALLQKMREVSDDGK